MQRQEKNKADAEAMKQQIYRVKEDPDLAVYREHVEEQHKRLDSFLKFK